MNTAEDIELRKFCVDQALKAAANPAINLNDIWTMMDDIYHYVVTGQPPNPDTTDESPAV